MDKQTNGQTNRQTDKQINRLTDQQTNRQTIKQTDKQTNKQTNQEQIDQISPFYRTLSPVRVAAQKKEKKRLLTEFVRKGLTWPIFLGSSSMLAQGGRTKGTKDLLSSTSSLCGRSIGRLICFHCIVTLSVLSKIICRWQTWSIGWVGTHASIGNSIARVAKTTWRYSCLTAKLKRTRCC